MMGDNASVCASVSMCVCVCECRLTARGMPHFVAKIRANRVQAIPT